MGKFRERLANIAIGPSALRNQGASGVIDAARKFLAGLDLTQFVVADEEQFLKVLDKQTEKLRTDFPDGAKNWGAARKAINLFLAECCYHRFICQEYHLEKIEAFLETPLDSQVAKKLIKKAKENDEKLPRWQGLKHLTQSESNDYQQFAYQYAKKEEKLPARFYLDVIIWQPEGSEET